MGVFVISNTDLCFVFAIIFIIWTHRRHQFFRVITDYLMIPLPEANNMVFGVILC